MHGPTSQPTIGVGHVNSDSAHLMFRPRRALPPPARRLFFATCLLHRPVHMSSILDQLDALTAGPTPTSSQSTSSDVEIVDCPMPVARCVYGRL